MVWMKQHVADEAGNWTTAFQLVNGGGCSSDSSQHDRGSCFPGRRCPRVEQFTVVCHIIVVTVDIQTTFEDVLVCDLVLMALTLMFLSLYTEHVYVPSFFLCVCVTCPSSFWTKCHVNLFVNNNNNNNNCQQWPQQLQWKLDNTELAHKMTTEKRNELMYHKRLKQRKKKKKFDFAK